MCESISAIGWGWRKRRKKKKRSTSIAQLRDAFSLRNPCPALWFADFRETQMGITATANCSMWKVSSDEWRVASEERVAKSKEEKGEERRKECTLSSKITWGKPIKYAEWSNTRSTGRRRRRQNAAKDIQEQNREQAHSLCQRQRNAFTLKTNLARARTRWLL